MNRHATARRSVRAVEDVVNVAVRCDPCGQLDPGTDRVARRHAAANPDHRVHMVKEIQINYMIYRGGVPTHA